ncbi:PaaI family thioesterase [Konateibacter massiliensis]|uniref:PaaI family thioesterase n=1 Tax=Konateibacter massiliensis TaxID=2002841 RepID=UPI000C1487B1|nr:PaaI family thioesterase [Konateibacter massiliensis]
MINFTEALKVIEENSGIHFLKVEEMYAESELYIKPEHLNMFQIVGGGCLYNLADITAGVAYNSQKEKGVTATGTMDFLRAAKDTEKIICKATLVKKGSKLCFATTEVEDDKGRLVARGSFVFCNVEQK